MKIGYLVELGEEIRHPPFSGPANHIRQVFFELQKLGHEVAALVRLDGRIWLTRDLESFEPVTVKRRDQGPARWLEGFLRRIQSSLRLPYLGYFESRRFAGACRQELGDCDVYLERFSWMNFGGLLAARDRSVPWVAEYNGDPMADLKAQGLEPSGLQCRISLAVTGWSLRRADHVVATGEGWRRNCIEKWQVSPKRVSVIENGTDLLAILDRGSLRSFRSERTGGFRVRVVYLGGFYPWHGIDQLLLATAQVVSRGIDLGVTLVGSGSGEDDARRRVSELGLEQRVEFKGRMKTEEYASVLADSDIGVSPYCGWPEYSGLKIFDYKAAGLACLASGENGQPATVRHGETGWIVPPCDVGALAEGLSLLSTDESLRRRLARAARSDAETHHSWRCAAESVESILKRLVSAGSGESETNGRTKVA